MTKSSPLIEAVMSVGTAPNGVTASVRQSKGKCG